jgi:hypothetical protein
MSQSLQGKAAVFHERETVGFLNSSLTMAVLISMVFLGAFLLFSMEPLVGRLLVPYFGGAVHVWLICLMFFQAMLLGLFICPSVRAEGRSLAPVAPAPSPHQSAPGRCY